jgi:hypothetical protein
MLDREQVILRIADLCDGDTGVENISNIVDSDHQLSWPINEMGRREFRRLLGDVYSMVNG